MPIGPELSLIKRLNKAEEVLKLVISFDNYHPKDQTLTINSLTNLITEFTLLNEKYALQVKIYAQAVEQRMHLFKDNPFSIYKTVLGVLEEIRNQYNNQSYQFKKVKNIVRRMRRRDRSLLKPPIDFNQPNLERELYIYEYSYQVKALQFNELIDTLVEFKNYMPADTNLTLTSLQILTSNISLSQRMVTEETKKLINLSLKRAAFYKMLCERLKKVKDYIRWQYGSGSEEYNLINNINLE